jgi:hypothetical protein
MPVRWRVTRQYSCVNSLQAPKIRGVKRHATLTVRYGESSRRMTAPRRARVASKM